MNILVKTLSDHILVRPDTTWKRNNEDMYVPSFVKRMDWCPVLSMRICRSGRYVSPRFARRYYDAIGSGVLLYPRLYSPDDDILTLQELFAQGCCLNHTSLVPTPSYSPERINECRFFLSLSAGSQKEEYSFECPSTETLEKSLAKASEVAWLRTGDILCIELDQRRALSEGEQTLRFEGSLLEGNNIDFEVKF